MTRVPVRWSGRVAAAAAGVLLLAGCGDRPGYDRAGVEHFLQTSQSGAFGDLKPGRATCPAAASLTEGMTVRCTLAVAGTAVPYRVTLRHVHATKVDVTARLDGVVVPATAVRDFVRSKLPLESRGADVDCGGGLIVAKVGQTRDCTLVLGAQTRPIKVTVKDRAGTVDVA